MEDVVSVLLTMLYREKTTGYHTINMHVVAVIFTSLSCSGQLSISIPSVDIFKKCFCRGVYLYYIIFHEYSHTQVLYQPVGATRSEKTGHVVTRIETHLLLQLNLCNIQTL